MKRNHKRTICTHSLSVRIATSAPIDANPHRRSEHAMEEEQEILSRTLVCSL